MEYPEGQLSQQMESDSIPTSSMSETISFQDPQVNVDSRSETVDVHSTQIASDQVTSTFDDHGAQGDAQGAARPPLENLMETQGTQNPEMSKTLCEPPYEIENQFILRLPPEHAATVRGMMRSGSVAMKDKLKIDLSSDARHATVEVKDVSLTAKVVDLPCVIGSMKTLDSKMFYKTADISQCSDSPDAEKEVKRLLCSDAEACSIRWEVIAEGEAKEIENQGSVPSFEISPGTSGYKQVDRSPGTLKKAKNRSSRQEYHMLRKILSDSSNSSDDDDIKYEDDEEEEDEEEEEEEDDDDDDDDDDDEEFYYVDENEEAEQYYEENLRRELQAKLIEFGHCKTKEGISSIVMEIRKQIHYMEKRLQEIHCRAQRQKDLIKKVENLTLKNHLRSVLEQLELQEKQKNEQIISLQEKLKFFLEK